MAKQLQFRELPAEAAVSLAEGQDTTLLQGSAFKVAGFIRSLHYRLLGLDARSWEDDYCKQRRTWVEEGLQGEVLNLHSGRWVKGQVRVRVTVEFCPEEPEDDLPPVNPSPTDSPLDDIRQSRS